jgi:hypothetical protein
MPTSFAALRGRLLKRQRSTDHGDLIYGGGGGGGGGGAAKSRRNGPVVDYDDAARTEYLTGFHRRKAERRVEALEQARAREQAARKAARAAARKERADFAAGVAAPSGFARSLALIALPSQSLRQPNRRPACSKHDRPPIGAAGPPQLRLIPLCHLPRALHHCLLSLLFQEHSISSKEHSRTRSFGNRIKTKSDQRPRQVRKTTIMPEARVPCGCACVPAVSESE